MTVALIKTPQDGGVVTNLMVQSAAANALNYNLIALTRQLW